MNKRLIILGILILVISVVGKLLWTALSKVKVDAFVPSAVIFLVDSSASNQNASRTEKNFKTSL